MNKKQFEAIMKAIQKLDDSINKTHLAINTGAKTLLIEIGSNGITPADKSTK